MHCKQERHNNTEIAVLKKQSGFNLFILIFATSLIALYLVCSNYCAESTFSIELNNIFSISGYESNEHVQN